MNPQHCQIIERLFQLFTTCPDPTQRERADGWSIKEVVGHLIDSASNNHQRLCRYTPQTNLVFPGYEQNEFVQRGQYATFEFQRLVALWYHYNGLLLHIFANLPPDHFTTPLTIGSRPTVTLAQLIADYFTHLEIHERQIRRIIAANASASQNVA